MIDEDKLEEIGEFLNYNPQKLKRLEDSIQHLPGRVKFLNLSVIEWQNLQIDQKKKRDIENWFKDTAKYIFELVEVQSQPAKKKIAAQVLNFCKNYNVKKILDYGCGIGEEAIKAARAGFNVAVADLPSKTLDFANWRFKKHGVKVRVIEVRNQKPLKEKYNAIFCFEVLQHLFKPEIIAKHLISHLKNKGLLFVTTRFHNPSYPLALLANTRFDEGMVKFFTTNGLKLIERKYQYGRGKTAKYLYIYQKA